MRVGLPIFAIFAIFAGSPEGGGFPMRQGRTDVQEADPAGRSLALGADIDTAKAWFKKRGIKMNVMVPIWMEVRVKTRDQG